MQPTQQLKRKTKRVLSMFSLSEGENSSNSTNALFVDSLFSEQVKLSTEGKLSLLLPRVNSVSISQDNIMAGMQHLSSTFSKIEHKTHNLSVQTNDNRVYKVTFDHQMSFKLKSIRGNHNIHSKTTFTFQKETEGFQITAISIKPH